MERKVFKLLTVAFVAILLVFSSIGYAYADSYKMTQVGTNPYKNNYNIGIMFMCGAAPGDGSVLLGDYFGNVVRWTASEGLQAVGHNPYDPTGEGQYNVYFATAVAPGDGSVLFGDIQGHIVRWTPENGLQGVGTNPYGHGLCSSAAPGDGLVLFGDEYGNVIKLTSTGIEQVGSNPYGSDKNNKMRTASAPGDGSVLFGDLYGHIIRWTASEGLRGIGTNPYGNNGLLCSSPLKDGSVLFGDLKGYVIKCTPSNVLEPVGPNPYNSEAQPNQALFSSANIGNDTVLFGDITNRIISWDAVNGLQKVGDTPYEFWDSLTVAVSLGDGSVIFATNGAGDVLHVASSITLNSIAAQPNSLNLAVGESQKITIRAAYSDGSISNVTHLASYRAADSSIVKVENGTVTGLKEGSTVITVQYGGMSYAVSVTVSNSVLANIEVSPNPVVISKGQSQPLIVTAKYQDGSVKDVTNQAFYQVEDNTIAVVSGSEVIGLKAGTTNIIVTYKDVSVNVPVTVNVPDLLNIAVNPTSLNLAVGESQQLSVTASFADGSIQNVTNEASYQSGDSIVANVNDTGLVIGVSPGSTAITVTYQDKSTTVPVNVKGGVSELIGLTVNPNTLYLAKGQTQQLSVIASFSDGTTQNVTSLASYQSSDPSIATVSTSGLVTSVDYGNAEITISYETKSIVIPITVGQYTIITATRQVYQTPSVIQPQTREKVTPTVVTAPSKEKTSPAVSMPTKKESVAPSVSYPPIAGRSGSKPVVVPAPDREYNNNIPVIYPK
jgi:uncharacterized protein YjdB